MAEDAKILLGAFIKPVGLLGEIRLAPEQGIRGLIRPEVLYQLRGDRYFPWFLRSWKALEDGHFLIQLEEVDSPEQAKPLCGQPVWVDENQVEYDQESDGRTDLIGYRLRDQDGREVGVIRDILDNSGQWLAVVDVEKREVLIPLAEENILGVQDQERFLVVDIPSGLLDL